MPGDPSVESYVRIYVQGCLLSIVLSWQGQKGCLQSWEPSFQPFKRVSLIPSRCWQGFSPGVDEHEKLEADKCNYDGFNDSLNPCMCVCMCVHLDVYSI